MIRFIDINKKSRVGRLSLLLSVLIMSSLSACSLNDLVKVKDPEEGREVKIGEVTTRAGALAVYAGAIGHLQKGVTDISENVSLLTDERLMIPSSRPDEALDARIETRSSSSGTVGLILQRPYLSLNSSRIAFLQLRDIIRSLKDPSLEYLVSASYALEGYSILLLAENYCSGIPLSTLTFDGKLTYEAGSSTQEALRRAVSLFDSSQMISHDSARFNVLAQVGKGRAYLSLGVLDSAYESVQNVGPQDVFSLYFNEAQVADPTNGQISRPYMFWTFGSDLGVPAYQLVNQEGGNGLLWYPLSGPADPRVPVIFQTVEGMNVARQRKFTSGVVVFPLARSIERKMIEAEYWLKSNDPRWLTALNEARQTRAIPDTTDPGTVESRVDLLFRERAFWFYMEGQRLADYRRMVRNYDISPYEIYPSGIYEGGNGKYPLYGNAFVFSPPESPNRNYEGCNHREP